MKSNIVSFANEAINRDHQLINARLLAIMKSTNRLKADEDYLAALRIKTVARHAGHRVLSGDQGTQIWYADATDKQPARIYGTGPREGRHPQNMVTTADEKDLTKIDLYNILINPPRPSQKQKPHHWNITIRDNSILDPVERHEYDHKRYDSHSNWYHNLQAGWGVKIKLPSANGQTTRGNFHYNTADKLLDALYNLRDEADTILDMTEKDENFYGPFTLPFPDEYGEVTRQPVKFRAVQSIKYSTVMTISHIQIERDHAAKTMDHAKSLMIDTVMDVADRTGFRIDTTGKRRIVKQNNKRRGDPDEK